MPPRVRRSIFANSGYMIHGPPRANQERYVTLAGTIVCRVRNWLCAAKLHTVYLIDSFMHKGRSMHSDFGTRNLNRAPGFDYRSPGPYFVTICAQGRHCLFGSIASEAVRHNDPGTVIVDSWTTISRQFVEVQCEESVVMSNHFHVLLTLPPAGADSPVLGTIIRAFTRLSTNLYVAGVKVDGWATYDGRLWQRSFHDHIVHNEREMELIRDYIATNPVRWSEDRLYAGAKMRLCRIGTVADAIHDRPLQPRTPAMGKSSDSTDAKHGRSFRQSSARGPAIPSSSRRACRG